MKTRATSGKGKIKMSDHRRERGDGKLGCFIWVTIFLVVVFVGWKTIPIKIATSRLADYMVEQARTAARRSPRAIRGSILVHARELDLPVRERDCVVTKTQARIDMRCRFTVSIDFPSYTYDWDFDLRVRRAIFQF